MNSRRVKHSFTYWDEASPWMDSKRAKPLNQDAQAAANTGWAIFSRSAGEGVAANASSPGSGSGAGCDC